MLQGRGPFYTLTVLCTKLSRIIGKGEGLTFALGLRSGRKRSTKDMAEEKSPLKEKGEGVACIQAPREDNREAGLPSFMSSF